MFPTAKRTFLLLLRTPMIPPPPPPPAFELIPLIHAAGPSRPRATSRTISNLSIYGYPIQSPVHIQPNRGYASDHGKKELYSDEAGSTGAGTDDVARTDAAFSSSAKEANPEKASEEVQNETGKDFTRGSPAVAGYSHPPGEQGEKNSDAPMRTSRKDAGKDQERGVS